MEKYYKTTEKTREKSKRYRLKNKEKILERQRKRWNENKEENNKKQRENYRNLPKEIKTERLKYIKEQGIKRKEKLKAKYYEYKKQGCSICGYNKCLKALDFHHKEGEEKTINISRTLSQNKNWEDMKGELDKCIILCSNCHRELHAKELEVPK
jgi:hypothetical protein